MSTPITRPPGHTYEDYLSDEPDQHGMPDGLSREEYLALPEAAAPTGSLPDGVVFPPTGPGRHGYNAAGMPVTYDLTPEQIDVLRTYGHGKPWIMDDAHYGQIAGSLATLGLLDYAPLPSHGYVLTDKGAAALVATMPPEGSLWQAGSDLVKMHLIYSENRVSAEVVYPVPPRTTVRFYTAAEVARWRTPSDKTVGLYNAAYSVAR